MCLLLGMGIALKIACSNEFTVQNHNLIVLYRKTFILHSITYNKDKLKVLQCETIRLWFRTIHSSPHVVSHRNT